MTDYEHFMKMLETNIADLIRRFDQQAEHILTTGSAVNFDVGSQGEAKGAARAWMEAAAYLRVLKRSFENAAEGDED